MLSWDTRGREIKPVDELVITDVRKGQKVTKDQRVEDKTKEGRMGTR